jgi:hypothetical protein
MFHFQKQVIANMSKEAEQAKLNKPSQRNGT